VTELTNALRIEAKFKNARLYNAIVAHATVTTDDARKAALEQAGPVSSFCNVYGLNRGAVYQLLNLKKKPLCKHRAESGGFELRPTQLCQQLAAILCEDMTWLFPAEIYAIEWPRIVVEVDPSRFRSLAAARHVALPPSQHEAMENADVRRLIFQQLETLTPREAIAIKARFGLDGGDEQSLEDTGKMLGVGKERARQIEAKALRKLRHRSRARRLLGLVIDRKPEEQP